MDPKKITPSTDSVCKIAVTLSWIFLLLINQHVAGQFKRITGDRKMQMQQQNYVSKHMESVTEWQWKCTIVPVITYLIFGN